MGGFDPGGDLNGQAKRVNHRHRPLLEPFEQGLALDELHDEEGDALDFVQLEDGGDVGVRQRGQSLRLGPKPGEVRRVFLEMRMDDLERDLTVQLGIARAVHLAHPAGAKDRQHFIGTDPRAWSQGPRL